ncbi:MAG: GGDEF domain-containing protein [Phycisphaerae bacterium]|nr:GGDEF domain-containing protein [Phycisphaerae bacterium]MCZ2398378.1 GGDEF domain-containing protein [Phycisphaerae bacterium]
MSNTLLERVRSAESLASPSPMALEVLRLARDETSRVDELLALIESDAVLTTRILSVINSSFYGMKRKISSLRQAVVALGLRALRVMALSFSLVDAIRRNEQADSGLDYTAYWRRSLTTAVAGRLLARAVAPSLAEDAFTCGLIADLGIVAAWRAAPELYAPVFSEAQRSGTPLHQAERAALGITHAELTAELLQAWGLPEPMPSVAAAHHGEGLDGLLGEVRDIGSLVATAVRIAEVICRDVDSGQWEQIRVECQRALAIEPKALDTLLSNLDQQVQETARLLNVVVSEAMDPAELRSDAAMRLAELSLRGELERAEAVSQAREASERLNDAHAANKRFLKAAYTDAVTGLANRAAFERQLAQSWRRRREHSGLALILLDLDSFKRINDNHGHAAGDAVLRQVADRVRECFDGAAFVVRYGGDELAVLLRHGCPRTLSDQCERIRSTVAARPIDHGGQSILVTASIGAAIARASGSDDPAELVAAADAALYRAKRGGRNRVETAADVSGENGGTWLTRLKRLVGNA